jgi:hypothetical protein
MLIAAINIQDIFVTEDKLAARSATFYVLPCAGVQKRRLVPE